MRAKYVVGADGAHSVIRESIGRRMERQGEDKAWGVMDLLAVTDFPDIRYKCTIQAGNGRSILLIPREGGHLFRLYVDVGEIAPDAWLNPEEVLAEAKGVLAPYTLDVKQTAWFSVYRVGHGVTDKFDDVDDADMATHTPRVFIAGDACHTHTAKAGQGMNVSMADTYNLGWKLVAVLQGRSPASLLHTYNHERHGIAEDLIATDKRWSKAIGAAQVDPSNPQAALIGLAEVQRQFITNLDFTAGMATKYATGPLTGDDTYLHLAGGYEPGRRFHSAEVIRLSDAKRDHLGHVHRADARWRLYAFADAVDPRNPASRLNKLMDFLAGPNSPVAKYTPTGWDADSVFDVRAILQQLHGELDWVQMHEFLKPQTGPLGLVDYEKVFCPLPDTDRDIFDLRRIDRGSGRARRGPARPVRRADPAVGRLRGARRVLRPIHDPRLTGRGSSGCDDGDADLRRRHRELGVVGHEAGQLRKEGVSRGEMDRVERSEAADTVRLCARQHRARDVQQVEPAQCLTHDVRHPFPVDTGAQQGSAELQRGEPAGEEFEAGLERQAPRPQRL